MTKTKSTKRALLLSALAMLLCASMLVATTFAWFTDSVTSARNRILSGNLDVELYYSTWNTTNNTWSDYAAVNAETKVFSENALYEPGYTEVVKFKVVNAGTLALKYNLNAVIYNETPGTNVEGGAFKLSDYIYVGMSDNVTDRASAVAAATTPLSQVNGFVLNNSTLLEPGVNGYDEVVLALTMPTNVGNVANYKKGTTPPSIELGITLVASQVVNESDDFGNDYDNAADFPTVSAPVALPDASSGATEDIELATKDVVINVPAAVIDALPPEITSIAVAHSEPKADTVNNTVTFDAVELVDQNGNIIDLTDNTAEDLTIVLPVSGIADGTNVVIYHDGAIVATSVVNAGKISYTVAHLCEVSIVPAATVGNQLFAGGTGTQADPFLLATLNDVLAITEMKDVYAYYKVADGVTEIDALGGQIAVTLCGSFDGNNVTFKNLRGSLFAYVYGEAGVAHAGTSVVENFTVEFANSPRGVVHWNYAAEGFTMKNVTVHGTIEHGGNVGSFIDFGGGSNQKTYHVTIEDCYSDATIIATANHAAGFVGHHYAANDSVYTVIDSTYAGEMYAAGSGQFYMFCGNWMNYKITVDGEAVDNNSWNNVASKCHRITTNAGTMPEKYGAFTTDKVAGYDHAMAYLDIGPNGNGTTVIGGNYVRTYMTESPVVNGDTLSTVAIKNFDLYVNADGVSETGVSADGKEYHIVSTAYNQEIGGASVRLVQYDADGNILCITSWKLA